MSQAPVITGIHTIGVPVSDQDKALAFYTGTLGLRVRMDVPMGGGGRSDSEAAGTPQGPRCCR